MTLTPTPIERNVTIIKSWVVNDPTGRWREWRKTSHGTRTVFTVLETVGDELEVVHIFEIQTVPRSRLWVEQEKEQWVITEYMEK